MADPRHEYIAGKVRGFHTRVTALDAPLDERARRFASAPVADASPGAFPARFRHKCVFPSFRANARDRHRPRRDRPSPRDFETDLRDQNPKTLAVPIDRWRNRSAYRRRKPSRAYSASPREPSRCPLRASSSNVHTPGRPYFFDVARRASTTFLSVSSFSPSADAR